MQWGTPPIGFKRPPPRQTRIFLGTIFFYLCVLWRHHILKNKVALVWLASQFGWMQIPRFISASERRSLEALLTRIGDARGSEQLRLKVEFQRRIEAHRGKSDDRWTEAKTAEHLYQRRLHVGEVRGFNVDGLVVYGWWCEMTKSYRVDASTEGQERLRRRMLQQSWRALHSGLTDDQSECPNGD